MFFYYFRVSDECNTAACSGEKCDATAYTNRWNTRYLQVKETLSVGDRNTLSSVTSAKAESEGAQVDNDAPVSSASLPIIPIAAGAGGFLLLVVVFVLMKKKKKGKNSAGKYTKAQVLDASSQPRRQPSRAGPRTSRGSRTSRGTRTSRGNTTGRRPPPPGRAVEMPRPNMFPPLAANKPLISKKKGETARGLDEA